jgi:serine protease AprX
MKEVTNMAKLLVIPHPAHLNALAAARMHSTARVRTAVTTAMTMTAEGMVGTASFAPEDTHEPLTLRDVLSDRRETLSIFATLATATTAKGIVAMRGMVGASARLSMRPLYQLLPSLGAVIMDEEAVDRKALEQTAAVFENVLIPLVAPYREFVKLDGEWIAKSLTTATISSTSFWHLEGIRADAARAKSLSGKGVLVGVLDTGIDSNHGELKGRLYTGSAFAEFDKTGAIINTAPRDAFDHGTHVCGLIAGQHVGVAPAASLAVAAVLTIPTAQGPAGYLTQIAAGLDWLLSTNFRGPNADPGVDIVNASLGGVGYDPYLYTPLAQARLALGTLMIAAIGNSGAYGINKHGSPGNYDITVGVGAVDPNDTVAAFSDWGTVTQHPGVAKPDMCAPGVDVWSCVPSGGYQTMSGTSMATPIVTGAAALLLEKDPTLSAVSANLQRQLFALTVTPPSGPRAGRGRLDLTSI